MGISSISKHGVEQMESFPNTQISNYISLTRTVLISQKIILQLFQVSMFLLGQTFIQDFVISEL